MADKPASPYVGLEKALLRDTQVRTAPPPPAEPEAKPKQAPQRARTHARTQTPSNARASAELVTKIHRLVDEKQHLASYTFRFRSEELAELERVFAELSARRPRKSSKNDLVRIAVNWLLEDYRENEETSMLAQVFARL